MASIAEKDLLRLSMILENQGATTRDRYICKLAECVLFDSDKNALTVSEIYTAIRDRFQLEFDITEIETAIATKSKGRIKNELHSYQLSPKVASQLATQISALDQLKEYVRLFAESRDDIDENYLLNLIQEYLYFCFNSNARNFSAIIGDKSKVTFGECAGTAFKPSFEEINLINDFIYWQNSEKNKFLYSVISSCYEYCLITSNRNPTISKSIFRGKKFFLDTNIIFRIAGFNKDERKFVSRTFVDKCREVGISLCYTSAVLNEIYRVIDSQIRYIRTMTKDQYPVDAKLISKISNAFEVNDFYLIYYNWCKESQNQFNDYSSFRNYLIKKINSVIRAFEYVDSSSIKVDPEKRKQLSESLMKYKTEKRTYRVTTEESIKTDVNQVMYLESLRPKNANSLWNMNEYIVSADQLLVSWAEDTFCGVPMVVIPSLWLSIILKITGRATDNDYKSFCMFMTLRHFRTEDDEIYINPVELLSRLSEKTIDSEIKELIITEILENKSQYSFDSTDAYEISVERAFDRILREKKDMHREELLKAVEIERQVAEERDREYKKELESKKTVEEYAQEYAKLKSQKAVDWFSHRGFIPLMLTGISILMAVVTILCFLLKAKIVTNLLTNVVTGGSIGEKVWSAIVWLFDLGVITLPTYFGKVWEYLSSDKRRDKLCSKYYKQQLKVLDKR